MNNKFIALSFSLLTSLAFAAQQNDADLKQNAAAVNGNGSAPTGNILNALSRMEKEYLEAVQKDRKLREVLDPEDMQDLLGQAKELVPVLAGNLDTKKFIGDFDALIPQNEALLRQLPDFAKACSSIKPAGKFGRDFMKVIAVMQMKNNMANPLQGGQQGNQINVDLLQQLLEAKKREEAVKQWRCVIL
jgi:hypothetical protein